MNLFRGKDSIELLRNNLPEDLTVEAAESFVVSKLIPFVCSHSLLIAATYLHQLSILNVAWLMIPLFSFILIYLVAKIRNHDSTANPLLSAFDGTTVAIILLLIYITSSDVLFIALNYVAAAVYFLLVRQKFFTQQSAWYYFIYLNVYWQMAFKGSSTMNTLALLFLSLAIFIAFTRFKLFKSSTAGMVATVISVLFAAFSESDNVIMAFAVTPIMIALFAYENRIIRSANGSNFYEFIRQSVAVIVLLIGVVIILMPLNLSSQSPWAIRLWALIVLTYQTYQILKNKQGIPGRYAWISIAIAIFVMFESKFSLNELLTTSLLGGLFTAWQAKRYNSRFLLNLAILTLMSSIYIIMLLAKANSSILSIPLAFSTWLGICWLTQNDRWVPAEKWWRGFISLRAIVRLNNIRKSASDLIGSIPIVGPIYSLLTKLLSRVAKIKGNGRRLGYMDIFFVSSQFLLASAVNAEIRMIDGLLAFPYWGRECIFLSIYVLIGSILFIYGVLRENTYYRLVGLTVLIYPLIDHDFDDDKMTSMIFYGYGLVGIALSFIYRFHPAKLAEKSNASAIELVPELK